MEEGFKERVQKLFGSHLFQTVPKSSFPMASWSVSDSEVERREWNRQPGGGDPERDERPCAAAFDDRKGCLGRIRRDQRRFEGHLDDLDEEDEDDEEEKGEGKDDVGDTSGEGDEARDIRRSIGLDSTLDHEDEEDEFDRAAICKEWTDGRLFMRDVTDHGPYINYHTIMTDLLDDEPEESGSFSKDPRADHTAASFRLQEDSHEGGTFNHDSNCSYHEPAADYTAMVRRDGAVPKSILKRKENGGESKTKKRVRFDPAYVGPQNENQREDTDVSVTNAMVPTETRTSTEDIFSSEARTCFEDTPGMELQTLKEDSPGVPDYIRNPSRYTKYTFNTSDEDDDVLNRKAFADFRKLINRSNSTDGDSVCCTELPKSVVFTPRRKAMDVMVTDVTDNRAGKEDSDKEVRSVSIAAVDDQDIGCAMDCDDLQHATTNVEHNPPQKVRRKYRAKVAEDDSDTS